MFLENEKNIYIKAAVDATKNTPELFIIANSGARMEFNDMSVIIDRAAAISTHTEKPPLLYNHDNLKPIGSIKSIEREEDKILIRAALTIQNELAREIAASSAAGFTYQASLGFKIIEGNSFEVGEKAEVNGRDEKAISKPLVIAKNIEIWECSVCTFGADNKTAVYTAQENNESVLKATMTENEQKEEIKEVLTASENENAEDILNASKKEAARVQEIVNIGVKYRDNGIENAVQAGMSAEQYELSILRASAEKKSGCGGGKKSPFNGVNASKVLEVLTARAIGLSEKGFEDRELDAADKVKSLDFRGAFEELTGFKASFEERTNGRAWVQAAASTYNLDSVLSNVANSSMLKAFNNIEQPWREIFKVTSVNNFKPQTRYRLASNFEFEEVGRGGKAKMGELTDKSWQIKAESYGKQEEITYQDLIDGEGLNVFGDIVARLAWGAAQAIERKCFTEFLTPADQEGEAFYSGTHGNEIAQSFNFEGLANAQKTFLLKKRLFGADKDQLLNVKPSVLVVPPSLKLEADLITKASIIHRTDNYGPQDVNPHATYGWRVVCPAVLEDPTYSGYSAGNWYLLAPETLPAFEVCFVGGRQAPTIRTADITIGARGIALDGWLDFGVASQDYRGVLKCTPSHASNKKQ